MHATPAHHPRHPRRRLYKALAVYLVGFLGAAPALALAHLTTVEHAHWFCEEHHQVEDVALRPSPAQLHGWSRSAILSASGLPAATQHEHVACLFLNVGTSRGSLPSARPLPGATAERPRPVPECVRQESFALSPLLLSAPKTSPPLVVA